MDSSDDTMTDGKYATTEIRVELPAELVAALDAFGKGRRMTRNQLIVKVLHEYVDIEARVFSVASEAASRNPILAEKLGKLRA